MSDAHFTGLAARECGEHRSAGPRAWCFNDSEWCTAAVPCRGCELPALRQRAEQAEALLRELADEKCEHPTTTPCAHDRAKELLASIDQHEES